MMTFCQLIERKDKSRSTRLSCLGKSNINHKCRDNDSVILNVDGEGLFYAIEKGKDGKQSFRLIKQPMSQADINIVGCKRRTLIDADLKAPALQ